MNWLRQRYLVAGALSLGSLLLVLRSIRWPSIPPTTDSYRNPALPTSQDEPQTEWLPEINSQNLMLNTQQCYDFFPGLFDGPDHALERRQGARITPKELEDLVELDGSYHGMIYEREVGLLVHLSHARVLLTFPVQIYILDAKPGMTLSRGLATLLDMYRAIISAPEPVPNVEFVFFDLDLPPNATAWAYAARREQEKQLWLIPDFGHWTWSEPKVGSYYQVRRAAASIDREDGPNHIPWQNKDPTLLWRGRLFEGSRGAMYDASKGHDWSDIQDMDWGNITDVESKRHSMPDHCKHKYLAHVEGVSYSGRLKYLQNCESVIVMPELNWQQHWYGMLKSDGLDQNYVQVDRDWRDLPEKMELLLADDEFSHRIARNSARIFRDRYLTPAAEACYWRALLARWRAASFEPELYENKDGISRIRGVSLESFLWQRRLEWEPS